MDDEAEAVRAALLAHLQQSCERTRTELDEATHSLAGTIGAEIGRQSRACWLNSEKSREVH